MLLNSIIITAMQININTKSIPMDFLGILTFLKKNIKAKMMHIIIAKSILTLFVNTVVKVISFLLSYITVLIIYQISFCHKRRRIKLYFLYKINYINVAIINIYMKIKRLKIQIRNLKPL